MFAKALIGSLFAVSTTATQAAWAQETAPSGLAMALWETRWERLDGTQDVQLVLRVLVPKLGQVDFDTANADMAWICDTHGRVIAGLPHASASQIVVNLANTPVPRGVTDPDAIQFFGVYRLDDNRCISEDF